MDMAEAAAGALKMAEGLPGRIDDALTAAAARVAEQAAAQFPQASGEAASGFTSAGRQLSNDVRHVPFVHGGVVFELIPRLAEEDARLVKEDLERHAEELG